MLRDDERIVLFTQIKHWEIEEHWGGSGRQLEARAFRDRLAKGDLKKIRSKFAADR